MERVNFFNGQRISADDLNGITETISEDVRNRTVDFYNKGVIGQSGAVFAVKAANNTLKILPFIAYTNSGERIYVYKEISGLAMDLRNTTEKRLCQQGSLNDDEFGWQTDVSYDIYVCYIEKGGRPRSQYGSGVFYPTRVYGGFEFYALTSTDTGSTYDGIRNNGVRLCNVTYDSTENGNKTLTIRTSGYLQYTSVKAEKIYSNVSDVKPTLYSPSTASVSVQDHIMAVGTGTVSPTNPHGISAIDLGIDSNNIVTHEKMLHTASIIGDINKQESGLGIGVNYISGSMDNLKLYNLQDGEVFQANGKWFDSVADTSENVLFLNFVDDTGDLPSGTYLICVGKEDCKLHVGFLASTAVSTTNTTTSSTRYIVLSHDGDNLLHDNLEKIQIESISSLNTDDYFKLATFTFDNNYLAKPKSKISSDVPNSNFITKEDNRVFGGVSANNLSVQKVNNVVTFDMPYTLHVDSIIVGRENQETELTGKAVLPTNYISGFEISYNSQFEIKINPGCARDKTNTKDIILSTQLIKNVKLPWELGGTSRGVGGLQNDYENPTIIINDNQPLGLTLHVFAISDGISTDVAIDTDVNGSHILDTRSATSSFRYIRRIGSITTALNTADNGEFRVPIFESVSHGSELHIYYKESLTQVLKTVSAKQGIATSLCMVPKDVYVIAKFRQARSGVNLDFYTNLSPIITYVGYNSDFELPMTDGTILYTKGDATSYSLGNIICKGYKDGRFN